MISVLTMRGGGVGKSGGCCYGRCGSVGVDRRDCADGVITKCNNPIMIFVRVPSKSIKCNAAETLCVCVQISVVGSGSVGVAGVVARILVLSVAAAPMEQ